MPMRSSHLPRTALYESKALLLKLLPLLKVLLLRLLLPLKVLLLKLLLPLKVLPALPNNLAV